MGCHDFDRNDNWQSDNWHNDRKTVTFGTSVKIAGVWHDSGPGVSFG